MRVDPVLSAYGAHRPFSLGRLTLSVTLGLRLVPQKLPLSPDHASGMKKMRVAVAQIVEIA